MSNFGWPRLGFLSLVGLDHPNSADEKKLPVHLAEAGIDPRTGGAVAVTTDAKLDGQDGVTRIESSYWYMMPSGRQQKEQLFDIELKQGEAYVRASNGSMVKTPTIIPTAVFVLGRKVFDASDEGEPPEGLMRNLSRVMSAVGDVNKQMRLGKLPEVAQILKLSGVQNATSDRLVITGQSPKGGFDFDATDASGAKVSGTLKVPAAVAPALMGFGVNTLDSHQRLRPDIHMQAVDPHTGTTFTNEAHITEGNDPKVSTSIAPTSLFENNPAQAIPCLTNVEWKNDSAGQSTLYELKLLGEDLKAENQLRRMRGLGVTNRILHDLRNNQYPSSMDHLYEYDLHDQVYQFERPPPLAAGGRLTMMSVGGNNMEPIALGFGETIGGNSKVIYHEGLDKNGKIDRVGIIIDLGLHLSPKDESNFSAAPDVVEPLKHCKDIMLTHRHLDHTDGLFAYIQYGYLKDKTVHATPEVIRALRDKLRTFPSIPKNNYPTFSPLVGEGWLHIKDNDGKMRLSVNYARNATPHSARTTPFFVHGHYDGMWIGSYLNPGDARYGSHNSLEFQVSALVDEMFKPLVNTDQRWEAAQAINQVLGLTDTKAIIRERIDDKEEWNEKLPAGIKNHKNYEPDRVKEFLRDVQGPEINLPESNPLKTYKSQIKTDHLNKDFFINPNRRLLAEIPTLNPNIADRKATYFDLDVTSVTRQGWAPTEHQVEENLVKVTDWFHDKGMLLSMISTNDNRYETALRVASRADRDLTEFGTNLQKTATTMNTGGVNDLIQEASPRNNIQRYLDQFFEDQLKERLEKSKEELKTASVKEKPKIEKKIERHEARLTAFNELRTIQNPFQRYQRRDQMELELHKRYGKDKRVTLGPVREDESTLGAMRVGRTSLTSRQIMNRNKHDWRRLVLLTGTQGTNVEVDAALSALSEGRSLMDINPATSHTARPITPENNVVVISQTAIPGNAPKQAELVRKLAHVRGFTVVQAMDDGFLVHNIDNKHRKIITKELDLLHKKYDDSVDGSLLVYGMPIHAGGHGHQEDCRAWVNMVKADVTSAQHTSNPEAGKRLSELCAAADRRYMGRIVPNFEGLSIKAGDDSPDKTLITSVGRAAESLVVINVERKKRQYHGGHISATRYIKQVDEKGSWRDGLRTSALGTGKGWYEKVFARVDEEETIRKRDAVEPSRDEPAPPNRMEPPDVRPHEGAHRPGKNRRHSYLQQLAPREPTDIGLG